MVFKNSVQKYEPLVTNLLVLQYWLAQRLEDEDLRFHYY